MVVSLSCSLAIAGAQAGVMSAAAQSVASPPASEMQPGRGQRFDAPQLGQLVAPIALYPDALVAQVLASSAEPVEVVEAERWMQLHSRSGGQRACPGGRQAVLGSSVKALTQFPSVLET